jgi:hypothetical protein
MTPELPKLKPEERRASETSWVVLYHWLESKGYRLRPRFHPDWTPSWTPGSNEWLNCEDSVGPRVRFPLLTNDKYDVKIFLTESPHS